MSTLTKCRSRLHSGVQKIGQILNSNKTKKNLKKEKWNSFKPSLIVPLIIFVTCRQFGYCF